MSFTVGDEYWVIDPTRNRTHTFRFIQILLTEFITHGGKYWRICVPPEEGQKIFSVNKQKFKFRGENKVKENFIRIEPWDGNWIPLAYNRVRWQFF